MLSSSHNIAIIILKSQQLEIVTKLGPLHSLVEKMGGSGGITLESDSASPSRSAGKEGHFLSIFSFYSDKMGTFTAWNNGDISTNISYS